MGDSFNLLLLLVVISIIFVNGKLITYQMDAFARGYIIRMTEFDRCQSDIAKDVDFKLSTVSRQ